MARPMGVTFSATADVAAAIARGHEISLTAYTLKPGRVLDALVGAADAGAKVRVVLEREPLDEEHAPDGPQAANRAALATLRAHGVDAVATDVGEPVLHLKSAIVDGVLYLDDRNWPDRGGNTVLRDDRPADVAAVARLRERAPHAYSPTLATNKARALAMEAEVVARGGDIVMETESFGGSKVSAVLRGLAKEAGHPRIRLLVADREAEKPREMQLLRSIAAAGVEVRIGHANEKMAAAGSHAWIGSTNATATFYNPQTHVDLGAQRDWGMDIDDPAMVAELRKRFEANWTAAAPLKTSLDA